MVDGSCRHVEKFRSIPSSDIIELLEAWIFVDGSSNLTFFLLRLFLVEVDLVSEASRPRVILLVKNSILTVTTE